MKHAILPIRGLAAVLIAGLVAAAVHAQSPDLASEDAASEQMSVRELMRLDTAVAVSQAQSALRGQRRTGSADSQTALAQSGALKLVAIYGVGKKLLAEVMVGTQPHIYMRGKPFPVGQDGVESAYLLRGITGSCVQLERKQESHTLCLHPSLWTARK